MAEHADRPLHEDHPEAGVRVNGRVVRNLTAAEYEARYADPGAGPHHVVPPEVLAAAGVTDDEEDH